MHYPEALIEDVGNNFNAIYEGKNGTFILVKLNGKAKIAFVTVKQGDGGIFYSVGSGLVSRTDYLKNKLKLWERAQSNQPKSPSAVSGQQQEPDSSLDQPTENNNQKKKITLAGIRLLRLNAIYQFNATPEFKKWVIEYLDAPAPNPCQIAIKKYIFQKAKILASSYKFVYSPDLNSIEHYLGKMTAIRRKEQCTVEDLFAYKFKHFIWVDYK